MTIVTRRANPDSPNQGAVAPNDNDDTEAYQSVCELRYRGATWSRSHAAPKKWSIRCSATQSGMDLLFTLDSEQVTLARRTLATRPNLVATTINVANTVHSDW